MTTNNYALDMAAMIAIKFTSGASVLGSSMIISQVMKNKKNRENIQQRLICFASIFDILVSTFWLLNNFMMPFHVSNPEMDKYFFGNMTSCRVQGFANTLNLAGIITNSVFISVNHLLTIKYSWLDFKMRKIEPWYYIISLVLGLTTAIIAVSDDLIYPAGHNCWIIEPLRVECVDGLRMIKCEDIKAYQMYLFYIWVWIFMIIITVNSLLLYYHVVKIEKAASKYKRRRSEVTGESHADTCKYSRAVLNQSIFYVGGFYITWFPVSLYRLLKLVSGEKINPSWLSFIGGTFVPSQGFFNAIVFFRPRALKCRLENPERTWITVICNLVASTLFCTNPLVNDSKDLLKKPKEFEKDVANLVLREGEEPMQDPVSLEEE